MAFHGITFNEPVDGVRPINPKSMAIIGLVATATAAVGVPTAALDLAFPLNKPVLVTDVRKAIGQAGNGGTLAKSLEAIADQGSPIVVVVRVAVGVAAQGVTVTQATTANVIGGTTDGNYTGIQALLAAEAQLGVRPRILGVPGLDTQTVTDALLSAAKKLRGFVYAAARPNQALAPNVAGAVTYRDEFGARELMLIWPDATGWDGHAVAAALGLRAMIDEQQGWHKSLSNVAVAGVTGISKDVFFDIRDPSTDAGVLNEAPVTTIVRMNGYRFWGNRTTSDEPLFAFEVATRTAQALQDALVDIETPFIDQPMTVGLVRDLEETGNALLRLWKAQGKLIGGRCYFDGSVNPAATLAAGQLTIEVDYTAVAPLEGLTTNLRITSAYYDGFGAALDS